MHKALLAPLVCAPLAGCATFESGEARPPHVDRYVPVVSTAPGYAGYVANLYLREIPAQGNATGDVVLFVHGAGTPAEVAFDAPVAGFSWMRYLAERGIHAYAMDLTGYGRSTRPPAMNDRCNLSPEQQEQTFADSCAPSRTSAISTVASDWDDIDAVVEMLLARHGTQRLHLVGWSQGGPRTGGYAARHSDKVASLVQLAPAYSRDTPAQASDELLAGTAMTKQSRTDFIANWDRQVGCPGQYDPGVAAAIFDDMLASDPVGATWGDGVRRAPRVPTFGWTPEAVAGMRTPLLMVAGLQDRQIEPARVEALYQDYGGPKVLLEMACASHNAMWEKDAPELFEASYEWIAAGTYRGQAQGRFGLP